MNEKVKDINHAKKINNEEHIIFSKSNYDSEAIIKSDLKSYFDIEHDEEEDLSCRMFNDYG